MAAPRDPSGLRVSTPAPLIRRGWEKLRRSSRPFLLTAAVLSFPVAVTAQEPVRLNARQAVERAWEENPSLEVARARADQAEARAFQTWRVFFPSVQGIETYAATDHPFLSLALQGELAMPSTSAQQPPPGGQTTGSSQPTDPSGFTSPTPSGTTESYLTAAVLSQPLINVDGWMARRQARRGAEAAELGARRAEAEVELNVLRGYFALPVSEARLTALRAGLGAAERAVERAAALHEEGLAPPVDVHRARSRAARVRAQLAHARADSAAAQVRLRVLLGLESEAPIVATEGIPVVEESFGDAPEPAIALADRLDLRASEKQVAAAEAGVDRARVAFLPRLNALAAYEWQGPDPFSSEVEGWVVGVMLSWTPFSGLQKWGELDQRRAELKEAEAQLRASRLQAEVEVATARAQLEADLAVVIEARAEVQEAQEAQELARKRYAEGLAPITELLAADAAALEAELRLTGARYEAAIAMYELRLAMGELGRTQ